MSTAIICILITAGCYIAFGLYLAYIYLVVDKRPVIQSEDEVILPHPHQRRN